MDTMIYWLTCVVLAYGLSSCDQQEDIGMTEMENPAIEDPMIIADSQAIVTRVEVSGNESAYSFQVTLQSPDLGCQQYADWWEVFTPDSTLIYRRILTHSHVNEQPFTRSGGPVNIQANTEVLVRGHMNNSGYGPIVLRGTVNAGFRQDTLSSNYANGLSMTDPLPSGCGF